MRLLEKRHARQGVQAHGRSDHVPHRKDVNRTHADNVEDFSSPFVARSRMELIQMLKSRAFDQLDASGHVVDVHGWMDPAFKDVFRGILNRVDPNQTMTVIEVGTWKGLSTTTMADLCKDCGVKSFDIIAVDTWLGAPEFWTWGVNDTTRGVSLKCVDGYPSVFYTFTKNVKALGHEGHIAPFPISSIQGAEVLRAYGIRADAMYVDASHEYDAVCADLEAFYPLLKAGGTMFGDDYFSNWPGVVRAVDEFAAKHRLEVGTNGVVWHITKPDQSIS